MKRLSTVAVAVGAIALAGYAVVDSLLGFLIWIVVGIAFLLIGCSVALAQEH